MIVAAFALREEIGEPMPVQSGEPAKDSGLRLNYLFVQLTTALVLDDPPRWAAMQDDVLNVLLRDYDRPEAADVVGPVTVTKDRARELAARYGGAAMLAEIDDFPRRGLVVCAGTFVPR